MDKYTGKRLDSRYEIHELIGVGGMAMVYKAYDIEEDKIVAIKILKDEYLGNKEFLKSFKNESKAIAVLSHPNIVKVYDVSFGTKIQYIVMEYIDGITLKEYITKQDKIKMNEAVYFVQQILCALKHAHDKGVIHRDIKPQNIMLLKDGNIKVTDFGIARFCTNETQTIIDRAIGSVHYIAPEQAKGGITDEKADIYSVGVMLYEMLTNRLPFEADNAVSVAIMQMQSKPTPPREINPAIPQGLQEITLHAMEKEPANRYNCADEMLNDIKKFQKDETVSFGYRCFVDDNPTKYVGDEQGSSDSDPYKDNYEYTENEKKKKSRSAVIIGGITSAVAIFALVFIFITLFGSCGQGSSKDIEVPDLVGMKLSDVQGNPEYKFIFKIESVYDSSKPEGIIIDQDPQPNTKKVKEGGTISLKVNSSGVLVEVPEVKGATEEVAKAKLSNAGLKCETLMVMDDETAAGIVYGSDPQEGSKVTMDSTVRLYVSKGPAEHKINMPDVINKSLSTARSELATAGLSISENISYEASDKAKDIIISSDPLPGVKIESGSAVKLTVSSGIKKEKTIEITVDLPTSINHSVKVSSYINGVLSKTDDVVPSYGKAYVISLKGSTGKKTVNVDIENQKYRVYEVDFDLSSNNVSKVSAFDFKETTNREQSNEKNAEPQSTDENDVYTSKKVIPVMKNNP